METHQIALRRGMRPQRLRLLPRRGPPAPALVLCSVLSVQFGQAFGKSLFDSATPAGVVTLRMGLAAILLITLYRPRLPRARGDWLLTLAFGTAIAGMNIIYLALEHLPVGVATTLQLLGPLTVALACSRKLLDLAWSVLAGTGLALFAINGAGQGDLSAWGLLFGLLSAVSMGSYVLLSKRAGARSANGSVLALALVWATVLWAPAGLHGNGTDLAQPRTLLMGLGVAIASAALPYSLELAALRTLSPRVVGILQSLEPAAGVFAGVLVLNEVLTSAQLTAIGFVSLASAASVLTQSRRRRPQGDFLTAPRQRHRHDL